MFFNVKTSLKEKSHNIGLFFDIGIPNFLFRIDFATQAMYYGLVPVEKNNSGKYEPRKNWDKITFDYFEKTSWSKLKWFTIPMNESYQVKNNIGLIRGENANNFIQKVKNEIELSADSLLNTKPTRVETHKEQNYLVYEFDNTEL